MTRLHQVIARNVRQARKRAGLSQADVATRSGFSDSYLSEIERGRTNPSAEVLERIAQTLGLRPYQLLLEEEEWEIRDRLETVTSMYADLKNGLNSLLDEALRRHTK
ncbi:MAG: helix-turn-helix domain-containing protein [Spirochaetes bacterium]|nr:helix-turn-helix domain-containing protein [Spirochaetota bacterium]